VSAEDDKHRISTSEPLVSVTLNETVGSMSNNKKNDNGEKENKAINVDKMDEVEEEEDEDDVIDDDQLQEYREMVEQLGTFPVSKIYQHWRRIILFSNLACRTSRIK
jgi:hypothetical protein